MLSSSIHYEFLLATLLKSTLLLGVAWLVTFVMRRQSAAVRHHVWSITFAALLLLPLLELALPGWHLPVNKSFMGPDFLFRVNVTDATREQAAGGAQAAVPSLARVRALDCGAVLLLLWGAGVVVRLTQMLAGWTAMERLRRNAKPLMNPILPALAKQLEIECEVKLYETDPDNMPITYGVRRPSIFVPATASCWSPERWRFVLLHELAHVRRQDPAKQIMARLALTVYWWNPLAWFAWREFLKEQERAADDVVLGTGSCSTEYASQLLEIARSMQSSSFGWAVAMAQRSQLEGRLLAILDKGRNRSSPGRASLAALLLAGVGIITPVAALQARSDTAKTTVVQQTDGSTVEALIEQGDVARIHRKFDEAKSLYRKAASVGGGGSETATAMISLGEMEIQTKNYESAMGDFEKAEAADSKKASQASLWMAIAEQNQNRVDTADGYYQRALAAEDPNSDLAATIMELYGKLLRQEGKEDEASRVLNSARDIRKEKAAEALAVSQPSSADVRKIGGNVKAPKLMAKVEPEYTEEARLAKYDGSALLAVEVGADGTVGHIRVVRALGLGLDQKAVEAVSKWRFEPATENGQPVIVKAQIEVNFRLL
jgi:TonB family protein